MQSNHPLVYASYFITCSFLVTTGTITFIEALRTNIVPMRHILNLETCISIVAAYFYGKFITLIDKETDEKKEEEVQKEITQNRYVDWMITTPIMLLVLILAFQYNSGNNGVKFLDYLLILLLNYGMLIFGYLGEIGNLSKILGNFIGFLFFGLMYGFIYWKYLLQAKGGNNTTNKALFLAFFVLWALYGIFYQMQDSYKNIGYNVLDLFSKCFVGIYFWSVSSKIFV